MGKPSSSRLSRISSHSSTKLKTSISTQKMDMLKKKRHRRTSKNIKKLFRKLKNESQNSSVSDVSQETVILLDSSANETIVNQNTTVQERKRKSPILAPSNTKKQRLNDDSLIIINDRKSNPNLSPRQQGSHINCSTPIANRDSVSIKRMIIRNFKPNSNEAPTTEIINLTKEDNVTKEIHKDSYLTIDLTEDSEVNRTGASGSQPNVRSGSDSQDCSFVSESEASLSMSGDSNVTVLENKKSSKNKNIQKYANGIAKLNASEKNKLLMMITKKILSGCNMPDDVKDELGQVRTSVSRAVETVEDTYIREIILGESKTVGPTQSRNSIGSNIYNPTAEQNRTGLRMIVIDGSNVAMEHTKGSTFSVKGLKICIDYFVKRGHVVKAFVPRFRCKYGKCSDPRTLDALERQGLVIYTPSREIRGRICNSYDDRYIVQCAAQFDGVIVSGDNYRDLLLENQRWRFIIENRLLQFTWVDDMIMFPRDPLGRYGPTLEQFLKHNTAPNV